MPEARRLASSAALTGAAREHEANRAKLAEQLGEQPGRKQAPPMLLAVLAALGVEVGDGGQPAFIRGFAWYQLFSHWASLRFSDSEGLAPQALERRSRGVFGQLTRTKTSGSDKTIAVLPVFVSTEAWIQQEWLLIALALWQGPLCTQRDHFLAFPNKDLSGVRARRALYSDAKVFSTDLLSSLQAGQDEQQLLLPAAVFFWSELSDRAGLESWLGALSVGADLRRFVGRWAAKGSEDGYVRSAVRITENCKRLVAHHARASFNGGADYSGEEDTSAQLRKQLEGFHHGGLDEIGILPNPLIHWEACRRGEPYR